MDIEYYEKTMQKIYEAKDVLEGAEGSKRGKYQRWSRYYSQIK
ncbi:ABC transporter substrate-binding protein [Oribacterium sp.]